MTVLYFAKAKKALPLNMINWDSIADICGDDTDAWPGHSIEIYPTRTTLGGKAVDCVRIRRPSGALPLTLPKAPAPPPQAGESGDMDDQIPF
jgi:hypothetical protein